VNFNSAQFLLFFPAVLVLYALVFRRDKPRDVLLLAASYLFYMSWNWKYAGLIALSTLVDYGVGLRMDREDRRHARRALLLVSLVVNLGLLGLFKYYNFFLDVTGDLVRPLGLNFTGPHHAFLLPVGISFYTFQTLSYSIDLYRKTIPCERSLSRFALFVSFFPQLVAGPIVRAKNFLPQLASGPRVTNERFHRGLRRIFRGLLKKVVIADLLATLGVDIVFANPADFSSVDLLFALYGYAFQIYNDFSGYSDIAIGAALMLGFDIPENFNRPYLSRNLREFWTRWHISLSSWLRDYLYIPLGGNRRGAGRTRFNLMATMILGGLWHGAALNFLFWGLWHGLLLLFSSRGRKPQRGEGGSPGMARGILFAQRLLCFHLVLVGWLLFRAGGMENLWAYTSGLMALTGGTRLHPIYFAILAAAVLTHFLSSGLLRAGGRFLDRQPVPVRAAVWAGLILILCGVSLEGPAFIYFQF
jgi:D-alanyl-lipoteichoic acid acyltransferase DltB (MBOAT superfamily)